MRTRPEHSQSKCQTSKHYNTTHKRMEPRQTPKRSPHWPEPNRRTFRSITLRTRKDQIPYIIDIVDLFPIQSRNVTISASNILHCVHRDYMIHLHFSTTQPNPTVDAAHFILLRVKYPTLTLIESFSPIPQILQPIICTPAVPRLIHQALQFPKPRQRLSKPIHRLGRPGINPLPRSLTIPESVLYKPFTPPTRAKRLAGNNNTCILLPYMDIIQHNTHPVNWKLKCFRKMRLWAEEHRI